ncbi:hypothetical protein CFOL_v3_01255 [Cephalotus follicularis]|uniref:Uncharacterized protein n=1 Tax=Cephalotus follicularis TaxID=3775 RepID=A0A1Q3APS1_CEPFO|nr:hypothetical protein CFOL_v3_01255 [Cephalotus follicularis]
MTNKKVSKESILIRFLKAPFRILIKARDFYIQSMTECSGRIGNDSVVGCPTGHVNNLPKTFSVSSTKSSRSDEDLRELMRIASTRPGLSNKIQLDVLQKLQPPTTGVKDVPRSHSVAIGKIDEDKECEFGEISKLKTDFYPRSRSSAV